MDGMIKRSCVLTWGISNTKFTFGYGIDLEQTDAVGNPTYATSSAKGYIPAVSTSGTSTKGLEAGSYWVYVFDANSTANCLARRNVTLINPPKLLGCTDNDAGTNDGAALNYSSSAGIDNNSCLYCKASDAKLVDYQSKNYLGTGDIIESFKTIDISVFCTGIHDPDAEKKLSSTGRNEGKALKDIPISLLDKQYKEFKDMILKITQAIGLSTTEAILFCLEYAVKKNKRSWFNR